MKLTKKPLIGAPMIKNIIFDMDGTLADTSKVSSVALRQYAPEFGLKKLTDEKIKKAIGYANPEFYHHLFPREDQYKLLQFAQKVEEYEKVIIKQLGDKLLFPHIMRLLHCLKENGCKLYVASTGSPEHVDAVLKNAGIIAMFDQIFCNKPEKILMVKAIINDTPKKGWVMVGDKQKDSEAAQNNNILSVGAAYGYCVPEEYNCFDFIIQKPFDILKILYNLC